MLDSLIERICTTCKEQELDLEERPLVLMVSGGSDSVALAYLMYEMKEDLDIPSIDIVHINHCLRDREADRDEAFVGKLAASLGMELNTFRLPIRQIAEEQGANIEAVARTERYRKAEEVLNRRCLKLGCALDAGAILVAHTADDRVENFYMRSIVGTGPGGFRSMRYQRENIMRPLLDCSRIELQEAIRDIAKTRSYCVLNEEGDLWCEDSTNACIDNFRAYVRHELVPVALRRNPQLLKTLTRTMNHIAQEDDMLNEWAYKEIREKVKIEKGAWVSYSLDPSFGRLDLPIQKRILYIILNEMLGADARVETAAIDAVLDAFADGVPKSGYVVNIQGDIAVSSNKRGVRIEPMIAFRTRRKKL